MKNSNSVKEIENKIFKQQKSMQQFVKNIDKVNKLKIRHNSNYLTREQIHDCKKIHETFACPDVCNIRTRLQMRMGGIPLRLERHLPKTAADETGVFEPLCYDGY